MPVPQTLEQAVAEATAAAAEVEHQAERARAALRFTGGQLVYSPRLIAALTRWYWALWGQAAAERRDGLEERAAGTRQLALDVGRDYSLGVEVAADDGEGA